MERLGPIGASEDVTYSFRLNFSWLGLRGSPSFAPPQTESLVKIFRATNRALRAFVLPVDAHMGGSAQIVSSTHRKLQGYDFYREILGSPKFVLAPMVDQSELVGVLKPSVNVPGVLIRHAHSRRGGRYPGDMVHK